MFVVEPPDRNEAEASELPSGPKGELLYDIITKGLKMDPAECLITPLVKCPVDDPEETSDLTLIPCSGLVRREIELAAPKLVLVMGLMPGQALTGLNKVMALLRLRKNTVGSQRIPLRITYGLTAMVAEPVLKKEVWKDLKMIFGFK